MADSRDGARVLTVGMLLVGVLLLWGQGSAEPIDQKLLDAIVAADPEVLGGAAVDWLLPTMDAEAGPAPLRSAAPRRTVVIGDVHGDVSALVRALVVSRVLDPVTLIWTGGDTVVLQMGDNLDRGSDEVEVLAVLRAVRKQARQAGGDLRCVLGNHEVMAAQGITRMCNAKALQRYTELPLPQLGASCQAERSCRTKAVQPGGSVARGILAERPVTTIIGETVFIHGGLEAAAATPEMLQRMNEVARRWFLGLASPDEEYEALEYLTGRQSVLWTRAHAVGDPPPSACSTLQKWLDNLNVKRLVVGHTVQRYGITSACGGSVWRVDTGMARAFARYSMRDIQTLELRVGEAPQILR